MGAVLIQLDGYDPIGATAVTLYACNANFPSVCHLNGNTWQPTIIKAPALRYDLIDGGLTGKVATPGSNVTLSIEPWVNFARYMLHDARIQIWTGNVGDAWGSYTQRFDGRVTSQPNIQAGVASLDFAVDDRWLDTPLLSTYGGTGGADGQTAQKGAVIPLCIGAPHFVPGFMIDPTYNVLQLSNGSINDVTVAFEKLNRFAASAGDYANYAALIAATIPAGKWATSKAAGLVRHGAPPVGVLAYHVNGDNGGADGWVRLPGSIIRRLANLAGGAGKYDDSNLTALNTSRAYNLSLFFGEQITAREAIQRIAASINCVAGVSWLGKLFVAPIPSISGTADLALDTSGASTVGLNRVDQLPKDPPFWKFAIQALRTWRVHSLDEAGLGDGTPQLIVPGSIDIAADSAGTTTTPLPLTPRCRAVRGAVDYSPITAWSIDVTTGITATINNTADSVDRGVITVTAATAAGTITVSATIPNYAPLVASIPVTRTQASPTSSGGTGATSATTTNFSTFTSTTFAAITDVITVRSTSGGAVRYSGNYDDWGDNAGEAKIQYSLAGANTWNDIAAATAGYNVSTSGDPFWGDFQVYPGGCYIAEATKTGLTASTDYDFRMVARRTAGSGDNMVSGGTMQIRQ